MDDAVNDFVLVKPLHRICRARLVIKFFELSLFAFFLRKIRTKMRLRFSKILPLVPRHNYFGCYHIGHHLPVQTA
jgi:hypothetical protein